MADAGCLICCGCISRISLHFQIFTFITLAHYFALPTGITNKIIITHDNHENLCSIRPETHFHIFTFITLPHYFALPTGITNKIIITHDNHKNLCSIRPSSEFPHLPAGRQVFLRCQFTNQSLQLYFGSF